VIARKQGIVSKEEIGTSCCYAVQDKFWATDPDGHQWEVYYFHEDAEFNDPHYELSNTSACCMPAENTANNTVKTIEILQKPIVFQELSLATATVCTPGGGCC
jgi:hypothetical protein